MISAPAAITVNDRTVADLPESLNTILSSLDMTAMFRFDLRKGPLGFFVSPVYYDGTYDENFIGKVTGAPRKFEISEEVWLIDYGVSYEVGRWHIGAEPDYGIITLEPYASLQRRLEHLFRMEVGTLPAGTYGLHTIPGQPAVEDEPAPIPLVEASESFELETASASQAASSQVSPRSNWLLT